MSGAARMAFIVGANAASIIALLGQMPGWASIGWGRWRSPEDEDVRLVAKAEDIKGYSAGTKIYFCIGWIQSVDAPKIHDLAEARGFEIVEIGGAAPPPMPAVAKAVDDAVLQEDLGGGEAVEENKAVANG